MHRHETPCRPLCRRASTVLGALILIVNLSLQADGIKLATVENTAPPAPVRAAAEKAAKAYHLHAVDFTRCTFQGNSNWWSAVAAQVDPTDGFTQVRCLLIKQTDGKAVCVFTSAMLRDPRFEGSSTHAHLTVCAVDLDHDGTDEIVVDLGLMGADWDPDCAFVFQAATNKLKLIGTLCSHDPITLVKMPRDQGAAIAMVYCVGGECIGHVNWPRWVDHVTCCDGKLVLSNESFPSTYKSLRTEIQKVLNEYHADPELFFYLGRANEILGDKKKAAAAYKKARSLKFTHERKPAELDGGLYPP
jgi:hypothetical protein